MLQLQRASAGSGKTYTLAKKFIEFFISEPDGSGKRRLRPVRELREALSHILAITFTNKATNEMKLRIVDKLNALGNWTPDTPIGDIDYLKEFVDKFSCSPQEIASHCRYALKVLLTDYGDFKVSTIDSFFQTVLRTFAYEADLDDTYQIELDSNYVTQMGLDTTLDEIETTEKSTQGTVWIESMMENKASSGKGWNIFQKKENKFSVYGEILNASRNLAKEDFKEIRDSLDEYFEKHPDFFHTFNQLQKIYEHDQREAFANMRQAARAVRDAFAESGLDLTYHAGYNLAGRVKKMAETWDWDNPIENGAEFKIPEFTRKGTSSRVFDPKPEKGNPYLDTPIEDKIESLATRMYEQFDIWRKEAASEKMKKWRIYRNTMPYVGLLQSVRDNSRLFLTDSNTVELGETNSILSRIIGDDDAPFVYERIGSRLEHFLIDEFQDTSNLQWHNLRPLLTESEGKGHENLIIGDAKQSIYRFRNADPSLITTKVPHQFRDSCKICGNSPEENTNWRSSLRIVRFNNLFFRYFSRELGDKMESLYSNTMQPASHKENTGYVQVQLFKNESNTEDTPEHFDNIPELIADMLHRGYLMKEIAVLVDTHEQGTKVIDSIMAFNNREDTTEKINFISADSLETGESPAVQTVISILEAINNGTHAELRTKEEREEKGVGDWSKLRADFSFFAMQNQGEPLSALLTRFLNGEYNPDSIREMIGSMKTTVLPALIENIIHELLPENIRNSEAAFLASLQDLTLEYCERYTSDIASFLQWWHKKGHYRSISSPENTNAVNIMTVHKSKGLEFRCVIVPYSKQTTKPISLNQREWLWVEPDLSEAEGIEPIPWIPVWSDNKLADTIHADIYKEYLDNFLIDKVNMAYVAYTRAIDELYIYTPSDIKEDGKQKEAQRIGDYLWRCGAEAEENIAALQEAYGNISDLLPKANEIEVDTENKKWSYGVKPAKEEVEFMRIQREERKGRAKEQGKEENFILCDYRCGVNIPALKYTDLSDPEPDIFPTDIKEDTTDDSETEDMRLYGKLMHSILEKIKTPDDLHRALLKAKTTGNIGSEEMKILEKDLKMALKSVEGYGWFDADVRVITERDIVGAGPKAKRPDRIIFHPDGTAVIVDYKFGEVNKDSAYRRQVKGYASALIKSGLAKRCEGYVWYVNLGRVIQC